MARWFALLAYLTAIVFIAMLIAGEANAQPALGLATAINHGRVKDLYRP